MGMIILENFVPDFTHENMKELWIHHLPINTTFGPENTKLIKSGMDLKIDGLPIDILKEALHQAKEGRLHILDEMNKCLSEPRKNMSIHAPKMLMTTVPVEKIGMVIGPQGKNIKALCAEYECELNVEEDGRCIVSGLNQEMLEAAIKVLEGYSFVPEVNKVYKGKVVKLMDFGAFVRIAPGNLPQFHFIISCIFFATTYF